MIQQAKQHGFDAATILAGGGTTAMLDGWLQLVVAGLVAVLFVYRILIAREDLRSKKFNNDKIEELSNEPNTQRHKK